MRCWGFSSISILCYCQTDATLRRRRWRRRRRRWLLHLPVHCFVEVAASVEVIVLSFPFKKPELVCCQFVALCHAPWCLSIVDSDWHRPQLAFLRWKIVIKDMRRWWEGWERVYEEVRTASNDWCYPIWHRRPLLKDPDVNEVDDKVKVINFDGTRRFFRHVALVRESLCVCVCAGRVIWEIDVVNDNSIYRQWHRRMIRTWQSW